MNSPRFPAPTPSPRRPLRRASQLLPLEQRFMFDGAVADAAHAHETAVPPAVVVRATEPAKDEGKKEVVLVDTSLANYKNLEAQVRDGVGIVEFDGSQDGLAQVAQWAAGQGGYDAIHVLSHGAAGVVQLGTSRLDTAALNSTTVQAELAQLGQALGSDGDLLLYGCDVAAGNGSDLLAGLARLTGADVAASTNLTGAASLGGDWTLEAHAGPIEARALTLSAYDGVLDTGPAAPSAPQLDSASDTGLSSSDGVTYDNTPTFIGSAETGTTVTIYVDGKAQGSTIATGGAWSYTSTALADGAHSVSATASDGSVVSPSSGALNINIDTTLPSVSSVVAPANTTYYAGQTLAFTVNFSEAIYVTTTGGVPRIALTIGSSTRYATYSSGSGSSALVFSYTVASSDTDADGIAINTMSSNGGKLSDLAGNIGSNTLNGKPSTTGVLVDGSHVVSSVSNVSASTANGDYGPGATVTINVTFSSAVTVDTSGGTPTLALSSGGSATYTGGSGSTTLSFNYTVGAGQNSADLDYSSSAALTLNGATITDAAHVNAALTLAAPGSAGSLGANKAIVIDTTPPGITGSTVNFSQDNGSSATDHIFSIPAQTISGSLSGALDSGDTVQVSLDNGGNWINASATGSSWSIGSQTLSGSSTLLVRVLDAVGNIGTAAPFAYVLDTTAPTTSFSNIALSNDTGVSSTDLITNASAQTITATLSAAPAPSDQVWGSLDDGASYTNITSKISGTTLTWTGVTLAGSSNIKLRVTDLAGNISVATSKAYVLDTTAPTTTVASASFSNDSGSSVSDFITNVAAQTVSGTLSASLAADETVYVSLDNGAHWNAATAAVGTNSWSLSGQTLSASNTLLVKVTDAAGNDATIYSQAYLYQTTPPAITGSSVSFDQDNGASTTDHIFSTATQAISGSLSGPLGVGESVQVSLDNGGSWIDATASGSSWSIGSHTLSGSNTLLVRVQDAAGNIGTAAPFAYVLDTTAPSTTFSGIALSNDSGASNSDLITNVSAQTISATLSAALAAGDRVWGSVDDGAHYDDITSQVSGTTLTWTGVTLAGASNIKLMVTDAAGNAGNASSEGYVLDTSSPLSTVASASFSADSGSSGSDFVTNIAAQTISGTLSANLLADETVYVSLDNGATWHAATATTGDSHWSLSGQTLSASDTLLVKVTDTAGNDGNLYQQAYVYDTTPPAAATVNPLQTTSLTPVLSGSASLSAGDSLNISVGGAVYDVTPVAGAWTLDLATAVPSSGALTLVLNRQYDVLTTVTDAAGNTSHDISTGELSIGSQVQPTQPPPTTIASDPALSNDSGASASDFITNIARQTISGSLSAPLQSGESVEVSLDGGATWGSATSSGRSWSYEGTLNASGTLQVRVSGDGGSGPVYSHSYTLDTTPPAPPASDAQATSTLTPVLTGSATLADGETLSVSVGGATYAVGVSGGQWSLDLASAKPASGSLTLTTGSSYHVIATITDLADNQSSASSDLHITSLPVVTGMTLSADSGLSASDFITNVAAQTVRGTLSSALASGQTVEVSADGGISWHSASSDGASWSANVTLSGSNALLARVTGADGSSAPLRQAYVLDTSAPLATPVLGASSDGTVSGTLSAPLGAGETLLASRDGGATWTTPGVSGSSWTLASNGAASVQLLVRDTAGNSGTALLVSTVVTPEQPQPAEPPIPPQRPLTPLPPLTALPAIPSSDDPLADSRGPLSAPPAPSQLMPWTSSIASGWPGAQPPSLLDTLPDSVTLLPEAPHTDTYRILTLPTLPGGAILTAYRPIPDLKAGSERIVLQLGSDAFVHAGDDSSVELSARAADGTPLPAWLKFDARSARFEGTPPTGFAGTLNVQITARDAQGHTATQVFKIVIGKHETAAPAGRASLGEQLRDARSAGAARLAALSS